MNAAGTTSKMSDAEYYEAMSRRYSNSVRLILRLETGRYALFGNDRNLITIDSLEEVCKHPAVTDFVPSHQPQRKKEVSLDYLTDV